jgi:hypothetical protein
VHAAHHPGRLRQLAPPACPAYLADHHAVAVPRTVRRRRGERRRRRRRRRRRTTRGK